MVPQALARLVPGRRSYVLPWQPCCAPALPCQPRRTWRRRVPRTQTRSRWCSITNGLARRKAYLKQVISRYEKLHPNIVIKETVVADTTKIITALSGGKPPDIVDFGLGQFVPELAAKGALTDLGPYIGASHLNMGVYVPAGVQVVTYNGHVYGLPFMNFNHALLYNKQLFQQAGISHPPTTLEQLTSDAFRLTKVDKSGKILQMGFIPDWPGGANGQAVNLVDYAWLFGGGWYNSSTQQVTADNPANIKALEWETQFYKKYGRAEHR